MIVGVGVNVDGGGKSHSCMCESRQVESSREWMKSSYYSK